MIARTRIRIEAATERLFRNETLAIERKNMKAIATLRNEGKVTPSWEILVGEVGTLLQQQAPRRAWLRLLGRPSKRLRVAEDREQTWIIANTACPVVDLMRTK